MLAQRIVEKFLLSFTGVDEFEVGIRLGAEFSPDDETKTRIQKVSREQFCSVKFLKYLQAMNYKKQHIYVRPLAPHAFTMIDDVMPEMLGRAESEGLEPCAVVETSPDNYQIWLNHGKVLSNEVSTQAAKLLAQWLKGDPSSADYRHFGRLPSFTNPKPKYMVNNRFPFSKLQTSRVAVFTRAEEVLGLAHERLEQIKNKQELYRTSNTFDQPQTLGKSWADFYDDPRYDRDLNRVDISYAIYAISRGVTHDEVAAVLSQRDLTHKGGVSRQRDYINRTINKAHSLATQNV